MKRSKRLIMLCLSALLLTAAIAGCAPAAPAPDQGGDTPGAASPQGGGEKLTVGVLFDFLSVESRVRQKTALEKYAAESGIELVFQSANGDEKMQLQQAENLITQQVDALVILAQNAEACKPVAKQCKEAGIPFIVTDRLINDVDIDYFVGLDNDAIGHMQVDYMLEKHPEGNWALISGAPTDPNCKIWHDAWIEKTKALVDEGKIKIVADEKCDNWDPNIALKHMENILTTNNDELDVAMVMNDGLATGAYQALDARGLGGKVLMSGLDGETVAFQRIVEGKQAMTVLLDDFKIADAIIKTAIAAAKGEEVSTNGVINNGFKDVPAVLIDPVVVDKENIDEIVIKGGFAKVEDVYLNVPEEEWPEA